MDQSALADKAAFPARVVADSLRHGSTCPDLLQDGLGQLQLLVCGNAVAVQFRDCRLETYNRPVRIEVIETLLRLNRGFYQSFADEFAASRPSPQPGAEPFLRRVAPSASVLDLGCGHGTLASSLKLVGHRGTYVGADSEPALLAIAQSSARHPRSTFVQIDMARSGWAGSFQSKFDWVFCLATLHHLPSQRLRIAWAEGLSQLLAQGSMVLISVWNFRVEPKWRSRTLSWAEIGLEESDVEPGDFLVDWRRGARGIRYVHHFDVSELEELARHAGCTWLETRYAGGQSEKQNLIQLWQANVAV
jgi:SAM-dependent methyltransferase